MGNDIFSAPISLDVDWVFHTLLFLDDPSLVAASCSTNVLQAACDQARLNLFLSQLNLEARALSRRLSADVHIVRRLCPPDVEYRKPMKAVPHVLTRLSSRAEVGDRVVISSILPWIEHGDLVTRTAAIKAISMVAPRGDHRVTQAILGRLRDPVVGGSAMQAAADALQQITEPGDPDIIARIRKLLDDPAPKIRYAALLALPSVVCKGDVGAIRMTLARADDKDDEIREVAMRSLGKLVLGAHEDDEIREVMMRSLGKIALETNQEAMTRIIGGLRDKSIHVRKAAMECLPCGQS